MSQTDVELANMIKLADVRKTDNRQLWSIGCSISLGIGINESSRYGQLIANELNLNVSFLTNGGSSITWAADQILRSDIRKNDIVVWGLTSFNRLTFFQHNRVNHINARHYVYNPEFEKIVPLDRLDDQNIIYKNIISIHQVINFCNKNEAKLYIAGLLITAKYLPYVEELPNYIQLFNIHGEEDSRFLDLGRDDQHPGPLTHKWYSEEILKIINA